MAGGEKMQFLAVFLQTRQILRIRPGDPTAQGYSGSNEGGTKMKRTKKKVELVKSVVACCLVLICGSAVAGGLEPDAPPGPTMKTLDEVEPRIPIHADDLPLTITEPNSYYLAESITFNGTDANAITINADNVTIDLMGYSLTGPGSTGKNGIGVSGHCDNVCIRNGIIREWGGCGLRADEARNSHFTHLRVMDNGMDGLRVGMCCSVADCLVYNSEQRGIATSDNSLVLRCLVFNNTGYGIQTGQSSLVLDCASRGNRSSGIVVSLGSHVRNCTSAVNTGHGIEAHNRCYIIGNTCDRNGYTATGAGILVRFNWSRIEANNVMAQDLGIDVDGQNNLIIKNSAGGNTDNYDIVAGNSYGPILNVVGVGDISSVTGADHPWANFEF